MCGSWRLSSVAQVVERGGDGCIVVNGEVMLEGAGVEFAAA